jgi:hypothetical protein
MPWRDGDMTLRQFAWGVALAVSFLIGVIGLLALSLCIGC